MDHEPALRFVRSDAEGVEDEDDPPEPLGVAAPKVKNAEHLVQGRKERDVLYELLLKLGLDLCVPIEAKTIAGKSVHSIGGRERHESARSESPQKCAVNLAQPAQCSVKS